MSSGDLEARVKHLEDIEAIKALSVKFTFALDSRDSVGIANLFADDAVFDSGLAKIAGKAKIREYFKNELLPAFPFTLHMLHNPLIEVKSDAATGVWYAEIPVTTAKNQAVWIGSRYEAGYVRVSSEWKFKSFKSNILYATPFDEGWVKNRMCL
jgi:ketosteroid isomerase-like protein